MSQSGRVVKKRPKKQSATAIKFHDYQSLQDVIRAAELRALQGQLSPENEEGEEDETADDGMCLVETYSEYWPAKLKIGSKHPDSIVCTASLASVESPDIAYQIRLPEKVIKKGLLSAVQLEALAYASQAHERHLSDAVSSRAGFLLGDGAGVGKGRTIAGIIYENHIQGRKKSIWVSVSNDLKFDAQRDFDDIGADILVHPLNKFHYNASINSKANGSVNSGVIFCTYSSLIGKSNNIGKFNTRMAQLIDWCGDDFDGCVVFDECHKAKNLIAANSSLKATKTGLAVVELQTRLTNARVVYSSATGASEPRNMAYMIRLGLWGLGTAFRTFQDFQRTVERRGVAAMEVVAMDMKLRGMYVARQLSFHGVTFKVEKVPLSDEFIEMYDECCALWIIALKNFRDATYIMDCDKQTLKIIWAQFWGAHQRFFKYLAIAAKVDHAVKVTLEAVEAGKCVVIGLQSTGEARTLDELGKNNGELDDYVSTAKAVFQSLVEKQFPALDHDSAESGSDEANVQIDGPSTSRKRIATKKFPPTASKRAKLMIASSDDDEDSDSDSSVFGVDSDGEYGYVPLKKFKASLGSRNSNKNPKKERMDTEYDPEFTSGASDDDDDDEESVIGTDFDSASDSDNDSDSSPKRKKIKAKSKRKMSKVQEWVQKKHQEATKNSKANGKSDGFKVDVLDGVRQMKNDLLQKIEELGDRLPKNTLDDLIQKLGGSEKVAEMTGRKGRIAANENGTIQYESRSETGVSMEMLNITEKDRFMSGEKLIAIISEAASSGISLQSDRRARNRLQRLHITLELPWAADRAIQQFGRTHRSNQVNAPEYMFLISDLAGEQRFVATVAKRLESLGALTHADRRATQTRDLSEFNIDNKYGRKALASVIHAITKLEDPIVPPPKEYAGDFFDDASKALLDVDLKLNTMTDEESKGDNIVRFLNRSLGVPVVLQNHLFEYFSDVLQATIMKAKKDKKFDPGLLDVGNPDRIKRLSVERFLRAHATGTSPVDLHTIRVDRGMTWEEALQKSKELTKHEEGFYVEHDPRGNKLKAILAVRVSEGDTQPKHKMLLNIYRPNTGLSQKQDYVSYIERNYQKTTPEKAKDHWIHQYESSVTVCNHAFYYGNCKTSKFTECDHGKRITTRVILSGAVLSVWDRIETQLRGGIEDESGQNIRMQVCRLRSKDSRGNTMGIIVPYDCAQDLSYELGRDAITVENVAISDDVASSSGMVKIEPKSEVKPEIKVEPKSEVKLEIKVEPKTEPNFE